ncbi:hypothetical protein [Mycobacterium montefiorense]|uniref:Uncharacterized protein n=1 Tax=Mycobacterium montefiorense TaxID=154654 RepID=A0ABQ0NIS3_9MYCO|nr:hypothetical protein [Mycobacterium montefiorense]GBG36726.1 hypothetical protein MmonteBS_10980 [Mycobacterium montefiorense]GKU55424.1 hypothetical protein NJB14197_12920 [Mycobacterium montefiorense]
MTDQRCPSGQRRMLRRIENRVLEQVWIARARRGVGGALVVVLAIAAWAWWLEAVARGLSGAAIALPAAAVVFFVAASALSALALALRRFRWCCAAAYCCGLAAVIGIGAFWWARTGTLAIGVSWLVLADLTTLVLCAGWLAVILTPIERSQPDMRNRLAVRAGWRRRHPTSR